MAELLPRKKIKDWLGGYLKLHTAAYKNDWPEPGTEDFTVIKQLFQMAFYEHRVTEEEAKEAIVRLVRKPPRFRSDHLEFVLNAVDEMRKERATKATTTEPRMPTDAEIRARHLSKTCPECFGKGTTARKVRFPATGMVAPLTFFCRCSLGRCLFAEAKAVGEPPYESLQLNPDLWRRDLNHDTWEWARSSRNVCPIRDWELITSEPTTATPVSVIRESEPVVEAPEPRLSREEFRARKTATLAALKEKSSRD